MSHFQKTATVPEPVSEILSRYARLRFRYRLLVAAFGALAVVMGVGALFLGSYGLSPSGVLAALFGFSDNTATVVILGLRLPRIVAALIGGLGLAVSGAVMQGALRNPLASPFTLGISNGAAFGAALAIMTSGAGTASSPALHSSAAPLLVISNVYMVSFSALLGALVTMGLVLVLAGYRNMKSDAIILAGIALSALFSSGTVLLQYFADDVQLAAIVFWSFGDVSRSSWNEIGVTALVTLAGTVFFLITRWRLNALSESDETAKGLGINPFRSRLCLMIIASLITAFVVAFHGVIAFLGLLAPHIGRRLVGEDMRMLIPLSGAIGSVLLLLSDTLGRMVVSSGTLPVGVITSFMGAPLFILLLVRGRR